MVTKFYFGIHTSVSYYFLISVSVLDVCVFFTEDIKSTNIASSILDCFKYFVLFQDLEKLYARNWKPHEKKYVFVVIYAITKRGLLTSS
jgi:hypothetical protein